ncbi:hypothetical protein P3T76_003945 [Phytophthora citrophthora]|uniref:Uncharacterized protein n=1 Tax=Phytophthora citrophthora TaxID=4793 RepID=A0AAD9LNL9_9STRA|nr:hypothetical protein P3T76_003945 [Phytophthora citrophthora]
MSPRRRCSFSLDEKRRVLEHLRACGHVRETIEYFYPSLPAESYDARRRLVLGWRKNAQKILQGAATRQGAARKRMRKPKRPKQRPPIPQGLADKVTEQKETFPDENDQEMDQFEPVEHRNALQDPEQDAELQDQVQDEPGIQDLIATAVEQSTRLQEAPEQPQFPVDDTRSESGGEGDHEQEPEAAPKGIKRSSFSLNEKRRVLEHLATSKNARETIEKFYPDLPPEEFKTRRRTIWRWRTCREQIEAGCADDKASARKKMRPQGIVCQRGPKHVGPQDVVDRLLTSVNKAEQRALKRKGNRELRPAPAPAALLPEPQVDAIVFSALGLPPTTRFPRSESDLPTTTSTAGASTMRPLERGNVFAIRRR